jgi:hypothetical protein
MNLTRATLAGGLFLIAGCALFQEEPTHRTRPPEHGSRTPEERRAHPIKTPGPVGKLLGSSFYVELQRDRPEADARRPVLVEEDEKRREVGFAYLSGPAVRGFVDTDVVVVATLDAITCYDAQRHEIRWEVSFADSGREVDDFSRRGDRLDVSLEGGSNVTLDIATGRKSVP